jgi:hypothetical protein
MSDRRVDALLSGTDPVSWISSLPGPKIFVAGRDALIGVIREQTVNPSPQEQQKFRRTIAYRGGITGRSKVHWKEGVL